MEPDEENSVPQLSGNVEDSFPQFPGNFDIDVECWSEGLRGYQRTAHSVRKLCYTLLRNGSIDEIPKLRFYRVSIKLHRHALDNLLRFFENADITRKRYSKLLFVSLRDFEFGSNQKLHVPMGCSCRRCRCCCCCCSETDPVRCTSTASNSSTNPAGNGHIHHDGREHEKKKKRLHKVRLCPDVYPNVKMVPYCPHVMWYHTHSRLCRCP